QVLETMPGNQLPRCGGVAAGAQCASLRLFKSMAVLPSFQTPRVLQWGRSRWPKLFCQAGNTPVLLKTRRCFSGADGRSYRVAIDIVELRCPGGRITAS